MATKLLCIALLVLLLVSCTGIGSNSLTGYFMTSLAATPSTVIPQGVVKISSASSWFGLQYHDDLYRPPYYSATAGTFYGASILAPDNPSSQWLSANATELGPATHGDAVIFWVAPSAPGNYQISGWAWGPAYAGAPPDRITTVVVRSFEPTSAGF
jgi:hypothetical protein